MKSIDASVVDHQAAVTEIYEEIKAAQKKLRTSTVKASPSNGNVRIEPTRPIDPSVKQRLDAMSDDDLIAMARNFRNGPKFSALFDGDTTGYPGDSEADAALLALLAFLTGGDAGRMERLFDRSARGQREKWQARADYREMTIAYAIECNNGNAPDPAYGGGAQIVWGEPWENNLSSRAIVAKIRKEYGDAHNKMTAEGGYPEQEAPEPEPQDEPESEPATVPFPDMTVRLTDGRDTTTDEKPEPPAVELTPIAKAMIADIVLQRAALHRAPTGAGKSRAAAQAIAERYRRGKGTLFAAPTLRLAKEIGKLLHEFAPEAFEEDAVAVICGHRNATFEGAEHEGRGDEEEDAPGEYPIHAGTRIIVASHPQLLRRGWSRFLRAIFDRIGAKTEDDKDGPRPAFDIIIDEVSEFIKACRHEVPLAHRVKFASERDGSGGTFIPLQDCPKSARSGNCGNCLLRMWGGEARFNSYGIRELVAPRYVETDAKRKELRIPRTPLSISSADVGLGPKIHVGRNTFAARVLSWKGVPLCRDDRKSAAIELFQKEKDGLQEEESPQEVLGHMLRFAHNPVVTWEHAIDEEDEEKVETDLLKFRYERKDTNKKHAWDEGVNFPLKTCEVPRLRFTDLLELEKLKRFAAEQWVGLILAGATLVSDDSAVLREVWPDLVEHQHPYPERKVRQIAVVFLDERHGMGCLLDGTQRLSTLPLEERGEGLVFCATKRVAKSLYNAVRSEHPSARLAEENDEVVTYKGTLHEDVPRMCYISYSRGVLGLGVNLKGIRFLVADAKAFRAIASFTPGIISKEEFERAQAEERVALLMQNLGRAIRGEQGKTCVLFVLSCDEDMEAAIREAPSILQGSELPPVFASSDDFIQVVDQANRWLLADGGEWPKPDPAKADPKQKGRPAKKTPADIWQAADAAMKAGTSWRDFSRKESVNRHLSKDEIAALKAEFKAAASKDEEVVSWVA